MKKIIFAVVLLVSATAAFAQMMVFPHVYNNRTSVTVDAWNTNDRSVVCWGPIYLDLDQNRRETLNINEYIFPRGSLYRTYRPMTLNATIESVSHSVYCN
ncbi:MAG: hypothetical protein ACJ76H_09360 [Bacteriovoracaceae bacterium]